MPRYLIKYFWLCWWGYFWKRLAFELADWVMQIALLNVGGPHPAHWGPVWRSVGLPWLLRLRKRNLTHMTTPYALKLPGLEFRRSHRKPLCPFPEHHLCISIAYLPCGNKPRGLPTPFHPQGGKQGSGVRLKKFKSGPTASISLTNNT